MKERIRVGAIIINDNNILLVKRLKKDTEMYYTIPGGMVDPGETLLEALQREVREECNLDIADLELVTDMHLPHAHEYFYRCQPVGSLSDVRITGPEKDFHQPGINEWHLEWVPLEDIDQYHILPKEIRPYLAGIT